MVPGNITQERKASHEVSPVREGIDDKSRECDIRRAPDLYTDAALWHCASDKQGPFV